MPTGSGGPVGYGACRARNVSLPCLSLPRAHVAAVDGDLADRLGHDAADQIARAGAKLVQPACGKSRHEVSPPFHRCQRAVETALFIPSLKRYSPRSRIFLLVFASGFWRMLRKLQQNPSILGKSGGNEEFLELAGSVAIRHAGEEIAYGPGRALAVADQDELLRHLAGMLAVIAE